MNDKIKRHDNNLLESLFEQARANQPVINDAGFSAAVMSALPTGLSPQAHYSQTKKNKVNWYDTLGLGLGVVACFSIIEPSHIIALANNLLPDRIILSPLTLLGASLTMAALAFTGWQALEGDLNS